MKWALAFANAGVFDTKCQLLEAPLIVAQDNKKEEFHSIHIIKYILRLSIYSLYFYH